MPNPFIIILAIIVCLLTCIFIAIKGIGKVTNIDDPLDEKFWKKNIK